jgi:hypothetical protein
MQFKVCFSDMEEAGEGLLVEFVGNIILDWVMKMAH